MATNGFQNGLSNARMRVSGSSSQSTYTAKFFSSSITDVIRVDFADTFRGNFRTAYDPTNSTGSLTGFREEAFITPTIQSQYDIIKHFRVKQIDGNTGNVVGEGIPLRWVPPSAGGFGGGSLFIKVLYHNSEDPTTFNRENGVIFCNEVGEFNYEDKTYQGNPMSYGSSVLSITTVSNVYKLTTVQGLDSFSGGSVDGCDSAITIGKGIYTVGQRVHLKTGNSTVCTNAFTATGVVISVAVDSSSDVISVFVEFDQPLTSSLENCTNCSQSSNLILCTGDSSGFCSSTCVIYSIQAIRKISTPECGTVQRIVFGDEVVQNGNYVPGQEIYQWKYEECGNHPGNGEFAQLKEDDSISKITGDYINWDSSSKTLYVLCPGNIMKIEYGNVYQKTDVALISRGSGILASSKFDRRTGSFVNIKNTTGAPTYRPGVEYVQSWENDRGGEALVQTTSSGDTGYNPEYEYVVGENVIQLQTENENNTITSYAAGKVLEWEPNPTALSTVPSRLVIKRYKRGPVDPLIFNLKNLPGWDSSVLIDLPRFRFGPGISPDAASGSLLANSQRNILPVRILTGINPTSSTATSWYDFSSETIKQKGVGVSVADPASIMETGIIANGTAIGLTRIKALRKDNIAISGNVEGLQLYNIHLMNPQIDVDTLSFKDVTHIGVSTVTGGAEITELVFKLERDLISSFVADDGTVEESYETKILDPKNDKQITVLPGSDVIEDVTSGNASGFAAKELTIQKIYNVEFNAGTNKTINVNDDTNTVTGAEFPSSLSGNYTFAVAEDGSSLELKQVSAFSTSIADNTIEYKVITVGQDRTQIEFKKSVSATFSKIIFATEVKCVVDQVKKNKKQKQFTKTVDLTYNPVGKFAGKWTAICSDTYDIESLISVFGMQESANPENPIILSENVKSYFGVSKEVDDYVYNSSIIVLSPDGVIANPNTTTTPPTIAELPILPKFNHLITGNNTSGYVIKLRVSGFSWDVENKPGIIVRESYKDFNNNELPIRNIPYYNSKVDGSEYHPSAIIDSRGIVNSDNTLGGTKFVILPSSSTINTKFEVYLPRYDVLYINKNGAFKFVYGTSSLTPKYPDLPEDGMILYKIKKPSYVFTYDDMTSIYTDNKRYTMRDIGKIDKRVQQLEIYTALSLLEKSADSLLIEDANGNNRFKNGIIVDPFESHKIGEISHPDYFISVDKSESCLRPVGLSENIKVIANTAATTFVEVKNPATGVTGTTQNAEIPTGLFMMPFTEESFVVQPMATRAMSLTPFDVVLLEGRVRLWPREDDWIDTTTLPDLNVNLAGENDVWDKIVDQLNSSTTGPFALNYGNWTELSRQVASSSTVSQERGRNWARNTTTTTTTTNINESRTITGEQLRTSTEQISLGDRVVDVSLIPYMRAQKINIIVTGLKTNTRLHPFFDGVDVSQHCYLYDTPQDLKTAFETNTLDEQRRFTNVQNGFKKTNAQGNACILFDMPSGTFRTGDRKFTVSDNANNDLTRASTYGSGMYSASGLSQVRQTTNATVRTFSSETISITEERTTTDIDVTTNVQFFSWDPLAQTFNINRQLYPNGIFLSSVDVFFARKPDESTNVPVEVQLRPTVNGFPDAYKIYPGAVCSLHPSQVNVSDAPSANNDATSTRFTFETPVYLEPGEHALILKSSSNQYEAYIAEVGQNLLNSTQRVTEQPYIGTFFASANASAWLPQPQYDMMMVLNKCVFETNVVKQFVCETVPAEKILKYETLNFNSTYQEFDTAKLTWEVSTNNGSSWTTIPANEDIDYTSTQTLPISNKLLFRGSSVTTSRDICPIINTERLSIFTIKNVIENDSNIEVNGELNSYANHYADNINTFKRARYITKIVNLEEGFESNGFKLILAVNKPSGTKIQAFLKYQPAEQTREFHENEYEQLIPDMGLEEFDAFSTLNETKYVDIPFSLPTEASAPFNKFVIKLCLYSTNAAYVPKIKDLRGVAVL